MINLLAGSVIIKTLTVCPSLTRQRFSKSTFLRVDKTLSSCQKPKTIRISTYQTKMNMATYYFLRKNKINAHLIQFRRENLRFLCCVRTVIHQISEFTPTNGYLLYIYASTARTQLHFEKHGSTNRETSKTIAEEGKEPIPKRGETV